MKPVVRILLVEDDEVIRETTRSVLEEEGYTVEEAVTGEEALEAAGLIRTG